MPMLEDNDAWNDTIFMKKYDFNHEELWFTRRAIQWLSFTSRQSFLMHIKKAFIIYSLSQLSRKDRDELYLARNESGRIVRRKTDIYSLGATCKIFATFDDSCFSDCSVIRERLEDLCTQESEAWKVSAKEAIKDNNGYVNDNMDDELLKFLAESYGWVSPNRKRLIVDVVDGALVQAYEDEIIDRNRNDIRSVVFTTGE